MSSRRKSKHIMKKRNEKKFDMLGFLDTKFGSLINEIIGLNKA